MTREEIEELKGLAASMGLYDDKNPCKRAVILGKAIKALEQEPVLDKIRAEIEQLPTKKCTEIRRIYINADDFKENVLAIIDKYKAESEVEE